MLSILTNLSRYLKQRELNRANEDIAELTERCRLRQITINSNSQGVPTYLVIEFEAWRGQLAGLTVRRDRLEKELGLVKTSD